MRHLPLEGPAGALRIGEGAVAAETRPSCARLNVSLECVFGLQELWRYPVYGKGIADHYYPKAPVVRPSEKPH